MDWLRISLLGLGAVLLIGIWAWHRLRTRNKQRGLRTEADDWGDEDIVHIRAQRDDPVGRPGFSGEPLTAQDSVAPERVPSAPAEAVAGKSARIGAPTESVHIETASLLRTVSEASPTNADVPAESVADGAGEYVSAPRVVGSNPAAYRNPREKILILHIVAPRNRPFTGVALGAALRRAGLALGEMSIYHAPHPGAGSDPLFSAANMVAPGTLSEADLADLMTPGVTLFLQLHLSDMPLQAFDAMLTAAHALAKDLGGSVLDANRSTATNQTLAHMREEMHQWLLRQRPDLLRRRPE